MGLLKSNSYFEEFRIIAILRDQKTFPRGSTNHPKYDHVFVLIRKKHREIVLAKLASRESDSQVNIMDASVVTIWHYPPQPYVLEE